MSAEPTEIDQMVTLEFPKQTVPTEGPPAPESVAAAPSPAPPPDAEAIRDKKGRIFDPAVHLTDKATGKPKLHKTTGNFIPKSPGRGGVKAAASPAQPAGAPAPSFIPSQPPPAPADPDAPKPAGEPAPAAAPPPVANAKAQADIACRTLYMVTGRLTGVRNEARATGSEHADLRDTIAAYAEFKGWAFVGAAAVVVALLAYFLGVAEKPETAKKIEEWIDKRRMKKRPSDIEVTATPMPAPQPIQMPPSAPSNLDIFNKRV